MSTPAYADGWLTPGREVYMVASGELGQRGRPRRVTVSRVGARYVVVTDAMGNEIKFRASDLTRSRDGGGVDMLRSLLDPAVEH